MNLNEARESAVPDAATVPAASAISPGAALAAARRAQNLSVDEVARQLRLSVAQVQAIEADAHERLPAPVFVRGFIRNYARLLRMDADALLQGADAASPAPVRNVSAPLSRAVPFPRSGKNRVPAYAILALVLIAGLTWYEFYWDEARVPRVTTARNTGPVQAVVATPSPAVMETPAPAAEETAAPKSPVVTNRLHLAFRGASWVEVRDRTGALLLSQTQPAGSERTLEGTPPFSLVIGNAQAVRVTYKDKPVDLTPHIINTVARMTLE